MNPKLQVLKINTNT